MPGRLLTAVFERKAFADAATWAARYARSGGDGSPRLSGLLVTVKGTTATLRATDGYVWATVTLPAGVEQGGTVMLPAGLVGQIASSLPEGSVALRVDGATAGLTCGTLTAELHTLDTSMVQRPPELDEVLGAVRAADLRVAIRRTAPGVGNEKQEVSFRAFGILAGPALRIAAADRYRLPAADIAWQPTLDHQGATVFLAPPALRDVAAHLPADGEVTIRLAANRATFGLSWPDHDVVLPTVAAEPVPYHRSLAMAARVALAVELDQAEFAATLKRLGHTVEKSSDGGKSKLGLRLVPGEGLELACRGSAGRLAEMVEADYDGPELVLRVNHSHLAAAVDATGGERIRLAFPSDSPDANTHRLFAVSRVGETGYVHIVMLNRYSGDALDPWVTSRRGMRAAA